ncbi:MAG: acetolactate synthase large subunit, partial [Treponema sp.]|nr:acetolactate synthase large subunit [Treponema sp.]
PGPVLIDIPKEVTAAEVEFEPMKNPDEVIVSADSASLNRALSVPVPSDEEIKSAAEIINNAKRPVIYAGGGVIISNASDALLEFATKADIPVSQSMMGRSAFPSSNPLDIGMVGMHGTKASNMAVTESDLLIALGARFSDRVISDSSKFAANSRILHIDVDPAEINKNIAATNSLVGNVGDVLKRLIPLIKKADHSEWKTQIADWRKVYPKMYDSKPTDSINPKFLCECIHDIAGDDTFITTEVGEHQLWTAQHYPFEKPRTFVTSGGLGTMGFGTGAAIGIQIANPKARVVHIAGDGSFRMNCNELATIAHYNLPLVIVVVNNGTLGNVRLWQRLFYGERYSATTLDFGPDWVKLADAYGIAGYRASNEKEFAEVFKKAFESGKACVIDAKVDIDEPVLPMVPGGKAIYNQVMDLN